MMWLSVVRRHFRQKRAREHLSGRHPQKRHGRWAASKLRSQVIAVGERTEREVAIIQRQIDKVNEKMVAASRTGDYETASNLARESADLNRKKFALRDSAWDEMKGLVVAPDPIDFRLSVSSKVKRYARQSWPKGVERFKEIVSRSTGLNGKEVKLEYLKGGKKMRSAAVLDRVLLGSSAGSRTMVHELGHILEHADGKVAKAARDFLRKRSGDEKPQWLGKLTQDKRYGRDEIAAADKFIHPYMGKVYESGATEIVSMGLEYLSHEPWTLAKQDPEYFDFIVNVARGRA